MKMMRYCLVFSLILLLSAGSSLAEQEDDPKVEQIRLLQEKQRRLLKDYNLQSQDMQDSFKDQIAELGLKETTDRRRNQIIADLNKAEQDLKVSFQYNMNILQQEEKALRAKKKDEPEVVALQPEEEKPLTAEDILRASEEQRLEMKKKLLEIQKNRAEEKYEKRKKREGSIGKNIREQNKDKKKRFKDMKRRNKKKKDFDLKLHFNTTLKSTQSISDSRRNRSSNKLKAR